jgi:hypothetical protein
MAYTATFANKGTLRIDCAFEPSSEYTFTFAADNNGRLLTDGYGLTLQQTFSVQTADAVSFLTEGQVGSIHARFCQPSLAFCYQTLTLLFLPFFVLFYPTRALPCSRRLPPAMTLSGRAAQWNSTLRVRKRKVSVLHMCVCVVCVVHVCVCLCYVVRVDVICTYCDVSVRVRVRVHVWTQCFVLPHSRTYTTSNYPFFPFIFSSLQGRSCAVPTQSP